MEPGTSLTSGITSSSKVWVALPLLGFKYTCYEIKSRDVNEKEKDFIFYNKPYAFGRPSWSIAHGHGVCTKSVLASTLALDLHAHTHWCLLLLGLTHYYPQPWIYYTKFK